ncbi:alpha/beta family hydrolase [Isoptericola dokdonensis]|uniref:Alpha/beta hydrolase family protein n=1 Tax=Isoptericola dokdonensis DS-3 TaxID=1300344 RepID=A0A161IDS9_9MICO|nr:alpha/beta family hydrolase [Isoptericola dokdonensis]ANC31407.1 Alpha/beta hydrolase family protein [Isoptericola dokdonensis DS-3]
MTARPAGLLLTPGAGADRDHRALRAVDDAVSALDPAVAVERVDFPYRTAGRRMPDRAPVAVAHVRAEAERLAARLGVGTDRLLLGGRSYGGRMCSMAVAEGLPATGLVLLSYPLHPPGKPDRLRTEHLGGLDLPVLFVSGDRDPFGSPDELAEHTAAIPGPVTRITLPGTHDVKDLDAVAAAVVNWLGGL